MLTVTLQQNAIRDSINISAAEPFFSPLISVRRFKPDTGRPTETTIINTYSGLLTANQALIYAQALRLAATLCGLASNSSIENAYRVYQQNDIEVESWNSKKPQI